MNSYERDITPALANTVCIIAVGIGVVILIGTGTALYYGVKFAISFF